MSRKSHFLFLFLDGVGIGDDNPDSNPFFSADLTCFEKVFGGIPSKKNPSFIKDSAFVQGCDSRLGVDGLPQSGTGQVSLFTGINAAMIIGEHFGPYPHSKTRSLLEEKNIFKVLRELGANVHFANAFPRQFFQYVESGQRKLSATTLACLMSDIPLCTAESLRNGEGISADITAERWSSDLGYPDIEPRKPYDTGRALRLIAEQRDFTMFEYFLTDKAGHDRDKPMAEKILKTFDEFLGGITDDGMRDLTILISSDHGNVEDLSVKTHTLNLSLTAVAGEHADHFRDKLKSIVDITPRIVELFK